jgi:hypothetical protein
MEIGHIRTHVVDSGRLTVRVVVDAAPAAAMASELLIGMMREGLAMLAEVKGDRITFGTEGEGLGRVTYEIGPKVPADQLPVGYRGKTWRVLGRVA